MTGIVQRDDRHDVGRHQAEQEHRPADRRQQEPVEVAALDVGDQCPCPRDTGDREDDRHRELECLEVLDGAAALREVLERADVHHVEEHGGDQRGNEELGLAKGAAYGAAGDREEVVQPRRAPRERRGHRRRCHRGRGGGRHDDASGSGSLGSSLSAKCEPVTCRYTSSSVGRAQGERPHRHPASVERDGDLGDQAGPVGGHHGEFVVVDLDLVDAVDRANGVGRGSHVAVDLGLDEVGADLALQSIRCAFGPDQTVGDDAHAVGQFVGLLQVLGGEEDRRAVFTVQAPDLRPHRRSADRVESGGRLVEEEHLRAMDQRHRKVEAPLHAARVRLDPIVDRLADVDQADDVVHALGDVVLGQPVEPALEPQHLATCLLAVDRGVPAVPHRCAGGSRRAACRRRGRRRWRCPR